MDFAITLDSETVRPQIVTPLVDSPAYKAGLLPRDVILSVNGKSTAGLVHEDVMALLRSDSAVIVLTIRREGHEHSIDVPGLQLARADSLLAPVHCRQKTLGYIAVRLFTPDSDDLVRKAVESFGAEGVDRNILDLRDNPGGYLDSMATAGSAFTNQVLAGGLGATGQENQSNPRLQYGNGCGWLSS